MYAIAPVTMKVSKSPDLPGRAECFHSSHQLFERCEQIGRRKLHVVAMFEGGREWPAIHARALTLYLWAGSGLKYFRRQCRRTNAAAWDLLKRNLALS